MKKYLLLTLLALVNSFVAVAQEPYAILYEGTLTFYYDNDRAGKEGTAYDLNSGDIVPGWFEIASSITKIVFHPSFADARPVSTTNWFGNGATSSLTTIEGIENLNTSCVTSMKGMFFGCTQLTTLDLSHFDTRNVTNMEGLFAGCSGLTTLDLSYFDTSNVTNMAGMFDGCTQLITLELSRFDTRKVTNMAYMFKGCSQLTTIYCGDNWNTGKVEDSSNMFQYCEKLVGGAGTAFDSDHTDKIYARVDGGPNNPGYLTSADAYAHFQDGTLTFYYDGKKNERQGQGTVYELNSGDDFPDWFDIAPSITKVVFHPSFAGARPVSTAGWFGTNNTSSLTTIEGIENLNTSCVTSMMAMFYRCTNLTTLNLRHFDTHNVINMVWMFAGCHNLTTIYCEDNWTTDNVEASVQMFLECTNLVGGAGTVYDASHVDAAYAHIDGGSDNPGYLTDLEAYAHFQDGTLTFYYDKKKNERQGAVYELNSGDNAPAWFGIASSITKAVFHTSFADARPVSTCLWLGTDKTSSLTTIEGIENLNTSCVTTMAGMFDGCTQLTTLDLSHFDTRNVTNMWIMFAGCSNLTTIYCGDNWNTDKVVVSEFMFDGCTKLLGGKGTFFDSNCTDKTYARADKGASSPGYLTGPEAYAHLKNGTLTFYYDGRMNERQDQGTVYELNSGDFMPDWTNDPDIAQSITKIVFHPSFADARPVSTASWFGNGSATSLTTIEGIENLNTSCVTSMKGMFYGCTGLTTLDLSHFDTSNVTNMEGLFAACSSLTKLDLSHFDTSNVTNMGQMFAACSGLSKLDLSHFDTRKVTNMAAMFQSCSQLTTIYCDDNWNTDKVEESSNMFQCCLNLVGGKGTTFNTDYTDKTYARIDEGTSKPGYLTLMGDANGDNVIDKNDALQILQYVVNKTNTASNVDVNGDGVVDAQDASLILQQVAKKAKL